MKLTKEECEKALEWFKLKQCKGCLSQYPNCWSKCIDMPYTTLKQLINDHFKLEEMYLKLVKMWGMDSNPPLKFEELKEGMWVWDNKTKKYKQVSDIPNITNKTGHNVDFVYFRGHKEVMLFDENRFYRREVKEDE